MEYSRTIVQLTAPYLEGQKFSVKAKNENCTFKRLEAGVPQGTMFPLRLYCIYTAQHPEAQILARAKARGTIC